MTEDLLLVSSCLAGVPCRYDGNAKPDQAIVRAVREGEAVPACAEQLGGLPTPRQPAEIVGGDGGDVLDGTATVRGIDGTDMTQEFIAGAESVANTVAERGITRAVLRGRSPSCGCGRAYDGTHSGELVYGDGLLTALLKRRGVEVTAVRGARARNHHDPVRSAAR